MSLFEIEEMSNAEMNPLNELQCFWYLSQMRHLSFKTLRACLLPLFKQYYTYFHTIFHSHIFPKNTNIVPRNLLPNNS